MGIYDREYYRREGPSFLGAITSTGQVCKYLILVNAVVFLLQFVTQRPRPEQWFDPDEVRNGGEQQLQITQQEGEKLTPAEREQLLRQRQEDFLRRMMRQRLGWVTNTFVLEPDAVLHG